MIKPGFIVSGIIHVMIFVLPVSMQLDSHLNNDRETKLYIMDSTPAADSEQKIPEPPVRQKVITAATNIPPERREEPSYKPEPRTEREEIPEFKPDTPPTTEDEPVMDVKSAGISGQAEEISSTEAVTLADATAAVSRNQTSAVSTVRNDEPSPVTFGTREGPNFKSKVMPEYPRQALQFNKEASVLLMLTIDMNGQLTNVEIVKGAAYGFTESAIKAVRSSTYKPAMKNGKPVMAKALLPVRFEIRR